uniref:Methionine S-methyltransferase n=1 Tax=Lygus hesperus TaxID=30085 RepID=A0A0A9ZEJ9_LYGHE
MKLLSEKNNNNSSIKEEWDSETGSNSHYFKVSENTNLKGDLEYNTRLANRNLMRSLGFTLLGSQTCWEFLLYDKVLGIKVVLPLTEFTELTRIESIDYTFYSWRLGRTIFLDRETVEFIRNRLHRHMPKEWLREECNKIGDLLKITSSLKRELELLKPLIKQLQYVKSRRPCTISNDRFSFKIINLHVLVNCEVTLDLKNSHKMSDGHITVKHINGKLDLDTVRLVFQALPSSDDDLLYRFVKCLDSETSQFLARE